MIPSPSSAASRPLLWFRGAWPAVAREVPPALLCMGGALAVLAMAGLITP